MRDAKEALQAGAEAGRCATVGATLIELFGEARAYDLTASRRLALAAAAAGAPIFVSRVGASPAPSAAASRWLVRAAPSRALAANAPGSAAFTIFLLRQRGGAAGQECMSGVWSGTVTVAPSRTEHSTHRRYLALWLPFLSAERLAKARRRGPDAEFG